MNINVAISKLLVERMIAAWCVGGPLQYKNEC